LPFRPTWACCLGLLTGAILGYLTGFGAGMGMADLGPEFVGLIGAIAGGLQASLPLDALSRSEQMSLRNARIQIALGWVLMIVGALLGVNLMADIGLVIWGIGLILQIVASVMYFASKTGGGRLGGA
jgi:hypothetical protein